MHPLTLNFQPNRHNYKFIIPFWIILWTVVKVFCHGGLFGTNVVRMLKVSYSPAKLVKFIMFNNNKYRVMQIDKTTQNLFLCIFLVLSAITLGDVALTKMLQTTTESMVALKLPKKLQKRPFQKIRTITINNILVPKYLNTENLPEDDLIFTDIDAYTTKEPWRRWICGHWGEYLCRRFLCRLGNNGGDVTVNVYNSGFNYGWYGGWYHPWYYNWGYSYWGGMLVIGAGVITVLGTCRPYYYNPYYYNPYYYGGYYNHAPYAYNYNRGRRNSDYLAGRSYKRGRSNIATRDTYSRSENIRRTSRSNNDSKYNNRRSTNRSYNTNTRPTNTTRPSSTRPSSTRPSSTRPSSIHVRYQHKTF